jgi:N-acylneuraminate cytidylyltransferase
MNVCVIPARGGSKRIPKKNIREFCGKPMIAWSIEAAKQSGVFDRIIVTTDSEEIASVARDCGADVPFMRPAELSDDHATTDAVFLHALDALAADGCIPEYACNLYATAPFVRSDDLIRGLEILQSSGASSGFSVTTFPFPIFRGLKVNEAGALEMFWPEHRLTRSQDLPEAYHDAGQFYWGRAAAWLEDRSRYSGGTFPIVLSRARVQDIDTLEDWGRAENLYRQRQHEGGG